VIRGRPVQRGDDGDGRREEPDMSSVPTVALVVRMTARSETREEVAQFP
jgi:hypothetical protein